MTKRVSLLLIALSIALGIHTPCYGLYVMVRSGFGELKGENVGTIDHDSSYPVRGINYAFYRTDEWDAPMGVFKYKDHKNLSVALGGRFDIFDIGSFGLEFEILGAYANLDQKDRGLTELDGYEALAPDFSAIGYRPINDPTRAPLAHPVYLYLKNQRIAGAQINAYWEQHILDWLSVGIGGGIGGAYVYTRFTTLEWFIRAGDPRGRGDTQLSLPNAISTSIPVRCYTTSLCLYVLKSPKKPYSKSVTAISACIRCSVLNATAIPSPNWLTSTPTRSISA